MQENEYVGRLGPSLKEGDILSIGVWPESETLGKIKKLNKTGNRALIEDHRGKMQWYVKGSNGWEQEKGAK